MTSRKRILSNWIDLSGFPDLKMPGEDAGAAIDGAGLTLGASPDGSLGLHRVSGPDPRPGFTSTICFARWDGEDDLVIVGEAGMG